MTQLKVIIKVGSSRKETHKFTTVTKDKRFFIVSMSLLKVSSYYQNKSFKWIRMLLLIGCKFFE